MPGKYYYRIEALIEVCIIMSPINFISFSFCHYSSVFLCNQQLLPRYIPDARDFFSDSNEHELSSKIDR